MSPEALAMWWIAPLIGSALIGLLDEPRPPAVGAQWVYVGTYTGGKSRGIYRFEFDPATGTMTSPTLATEAENPSFLAVHPSRKFLYAVGEVARSEGKPGGTVTAFAIDPKSGSLTRLNRQSTVGDGPCFVAVDRTGKALLAANYGGGSVASFPIGDDGRIGPASSVLQHEGSSVVKDRQAGPHAHSINVDAGNRFAVAADLGLDRLLVYRLDPSRATLAPNDPPFAAVAPGSGPRHFAFHPDGRRAYAINELNSTVAAFDYDADRGVLAERQSVSTIPAGYTKPNAPADIHVHPSGKFLYGSNRGDDTIAAFAIDPDNGLLTAIEQESTGGKTPRNFAIDPTGRFLLAANQDSGTIVVLAIDPETGGLAPTGRKVEAPSPVCLTFVPKGE